MICERPVDVVEAAVEGRWVLNAAICASERAVWVRPCCDVSHQTASSLVSRTFSVRRMLLDFPAELRHVAPAAGASCLVQLLDVALGLLALRGVLRCCKLPTNACDDVAGKRGNSTFTASGAHTAIVLGIALWRYGESQCVGMHSQQRMQYATTPAMAVLLSRSDSNNPPTQRAGPGPLPR